MAEFDGQMNAWKQFQGTELGAVMARLYSDKNRPAINYPKPKTKQFKPDKQFRPVLNRPDAEDPTKTTRRNVSLNVPKVCGRPTASGNIDENYLPIQYIARRKSEKEIRKELDEIRMRQEHYRPAHVQPFSSDAEKDRLNQIFTYKGGKILPNEVSFPVADAPFEIANRERERARIEQIRIRRGLTVMNTSQPKKSLSVEEEMLEQISGEIEERQSYLQSMKSCGEMDKAEEAKLRMEISQRVAELKRLEAKAGNLL